MLLDQIRCVQAISSPISFLSTRRLFIDALHCIYATYVIVSCFSDLDTPIVRHCCGNQVFRIYFELIDIIAHVNWTGSLRYRLIFQSITATAFGCTGKEKCQDLPLLTMGPAAFLTFCDYHLHNISIFTALTDRNDKKVVQLPYNITQLRCCIAYFLNYRLGFVIFTFFTN